ncbi:MAG TPA: phage holin family protein [Candidatus Dormibacteraeota bacterium]
MAKHKYDAPSAELAADIVESAQQLVRLEIALAKQEAKELAIRNGVAIGMLAAGGFLAMLTLLVAVPVTIVLVFDSWIAGLVWVVFYAVVAAVLVLVGKSRLKLKPPERTIASLKETRAWLVHQLTTNGK